MTRNLAIAVVALALGACSVTTEPLTQAELAQNAESSLAAVTADQQPVTNAISLYEAMARALKYNLDHRVELMAKALADSKLALATTDMLPSLAANGGWSGRHPKSYSYSETLSGVRSVDPSTSSDSSSVVKDLTFSWNILDFGLSYVRAKQASDRALLAEEQRRKVINTIIEDVRTAYWRSVSADRLLAGFKKLEARVERAIGNARALRSQGYTSPVAALTFQRELVEIKRKIQRFEIELRTSKIQLAALMNLDPSTPYDLVIPRRDLSSVALAIPSQEMVRLAFLNRPELRENAYKQRINSREAEAALLELLPGIQLYAGANFDSNSFLLDNNWVSWGAKAGWNAMRLFAYPAKKQVLGSESALISQQTLATSMAIMTQVEVARLRYAHLRKAAATSGEYYKLQSDILRQVRASAGADAASEQSAIREEMNTLVASVEYDMTYADLQNAFAGIYASIGVDPWGDSLDTNLPVEELAANLRKTWRERGDVDG
ncbi:MAG: TolC family protein [Nitratireductor sp.]